MTPTSPAPTLPVPTLATDLPDGLTVEEAIRIAEAISATHAESTRAVYRCMWGQWERWCQARGVVPMPASPAMICAYLTDRAGDGVAVGTLDMDCGAISYEHRRHGLEDPILSDAVRQVRRGLRRLIGAAPRRQARPLQTEDIRIIVTAIDRTTPKGTRDAAIILLGFASALRRSELAALEVGDIEYKPGGIIVTVAKSKSDQDGEGQRVAVVHGQHAATDPIGALNAWLAIRGRASGPLFTSLQRRIVGLEPISGQAIAIALRNRAREAGFDAERITPHSLRAGHATSAAMAGVSLDRIAAQTRHKRLSTLIERYIRPAQALEFSSSRDLGL
ncbi:MAG: site-specific integrase [Marmoricola sp.]